MPAGGQEIGRFAWEKIAEPRTKAVRFVDEATGKFIPDMEGDCYVVLELDGKFISLFEETLTVDIVGALPHRDLEEAIRVCGFHAGYQRVVTPNIKPCDGIEVHCAINMGTLFLALSIDSGIDSFKYTAAAGIVIPRRSSERRMELVTSYFPTEDVEDVKRECEEFSQRVIKSSTVITSKRELGQILVYHPDRYRWSDEAWKAAVGVASRRWRHMSSRRKKIAKMIPRALENYAQRPHDPKKVEVSGIPDDLFTKQRSQVREWLQVALEDAYLNCCVVLYTPTENAAGEIVTEGARLAPKLEIRHEWEIRGNTLRLWLVEVSNRPEPLPPPPGTLSFYDL